MYVYMEFKRGVKEQMVILNGSSWWGKIEMSNEEKEM